METERIRLEKAIEGAAVKYGIELAVLFGSRVSGRTHKESDTDIAIISVHQLSPREIASFAHEIAGSVGSLVEVVDLRTAPPLLLRDVARDGILLYEKEPLTFERFRMYAHKLFMESKPLRALRRASLDRFLSKTAV